MNNFKINLGTSEISRISCVNHKSNNAMRYGIKHPKFLVYWQVT